MDQILKLDDGEALEGEISEMKDPEQTLASSDTRHQWILIPAKLMKNVLAQRFILANYDLIRDG